MGISPRASLAAVACLALFAPSAANGAEPAPGAAAVAPVAPARTNKLTTRSVIAAVGDRALLRATLTSADGKPIGNANVIFSLNGVELGRAQTGADGAAVAEHKVADTTKSGSNTVDVKAVDATGRAGTSSILAASTLTMAVFKSPTFYGFPSVMQTPPKGTTKGKITFYLGLYRSTDQTKVVGRNVRVTFLGKSQVVKTLEQSTPATFELGPEDQGKSDALELAFEGDGAYLPNVEKSKSNYGVDPAPVSIPDFTYEIDDASPKQRALGQSTTIKAYLRTTSKKDATPGLANTKFRVRGIGGPVNEKFDVGTGTTDANGRASFTYTHATPVKPGKYQLEVAIEKDGKLFLPSEASMADLSHYRGSIEIAKTAPVITIIKAPKSTTLDEWITVEVRMTRATDNKPISLGIGLCAAKGDNCTTSTTKEDGTAKLTLHASKLGTGKQTLNLTALAFPDEPYERTTAKVDVDVFAVMANSAPLPAPLQVK